MNILIALPYPSDDENDSPESTDVWDMLMADFADHMDVSLLPGNPPATVELYQTIKAFVFRLSVDDAVGVAMINSRDVDCNVLDIVKA
jgi:hypothetical protein